MRAITFFHKKDHMIGKQKPFYFWYNTYEGKSECLYFSQQDGMMKKEDAIRVR